MRASNLKQAETDRLFYVEVRDRLDGRRFPVGYFWAKDQGKAIDRARSFARDWFRNLQTRTIEPVATEVQGSLNVNDVIATIEQERAGGTD